MNAVATAFRVCERSCGCVIACACVYVYVGLCVCICACMEVRVCMFCFREENCGNSAANAQGVGNDAEEIGGRSAAVETAPHGGKSAAVDTDVIATEIADKNQVVCFFLCCIAVFTATLKQCNSQTVQLQCSPPLSERCFFGVMHAPLRCLPPLSI